jgi:hypothetical protein
MKYQTTERDLMTDQVRISMSDDDINDLLKSDRDLMKARKQLAAIRYLVDKQLRGKSDIQMMQDNCKTLTLIGDIANGKIVDHPDGI